MQFPASNDEKNVMKMDISKIKLFDLFGIYHKLSYQSLLHLIWPETRLLPYTRGI